MHDDTNAEIPTLTEVVEQPEAAHPAADDPVWRAKIDSVAERLAPAIVERMLGEMQTGLTERVSEQLRREIPVIVAELLEQRPAKSPER